MSQNLNVLEFLEADFSRSHDFVRERRHCNQLFCHSSVLSLNETGGIKTNWKCFVQICLGCNRY